MKRRSCNRALARRARRKACCKAVTALAIVGFAATIALAGWLAASILSNDSFQPAPDADAEGTAEKTGRITVDWDFWNGIDPRIVAWITVPGTPICHPVVQAPKSSPDRYLSLDVYGKPNYLGSIFVDADLEGKDWNTYKNICLLGHNAGDGRLMFAPLTNYRNPSWQKNHRYAFLATRKKIYRLRIVASECISGATKAKKTLFKSKEEFRSWLSNRLGNAMLYDESKESILEKKQVFTFATCSYFFQPDNERTIVYAVEV